MDGFLPLCEQAARLGGAVLLSYAGRAKVREKSRHDLVTEADLASQQAIRELVAANFPDHAFLGEEDGDAIFAAARPATAEFRWIVDPLDGTANFVHNLGNFAVSVALEQSGEIIAGAVYDPMANECFCAAKGRGASLNGEPIQVSGRTALDSAMIAASFSPNIQRHSIEIDRFVEVLHAARSIRRLGSAALNLCYVAAGRLDGYWATSLKVWDIAAGVLILTEAQGIITQLDGAPLLLARPELVAAASAELHLELLNTLRIPAKTID